MSHTKSATRQYRTLSLISCVQREVPCFPLRNVSIAFLRDRIRLRSATSQNIYLEGNLRTCRPTCPALLPSPCAAQTRFYLLPSWNENHATTADRSCLVFRVPFSTRVSFS